MVKTFRYHYLVVHGLFLCDFLFLTNYNYDVFSSPLDLMVTGIPRDFLSKKSIPRDTTSWKSRPFLPVFSKLLIEATYERPPF